MTSTLQIPSCASSDRTSSCRRQHRPSAGSICQSGNVVQSDALGCLLNWVFTFSYDVTSSIRIAKPSRWMDALALLRDEEALSRHKAHVLRICSPSRIAPSACQRVLFFVSFRRTKQATRPFGSTRQDQILVRLEPQTSVLLNWGFTWGSHRGISHGHAIGRLPRADHYERARKVVMSV